MTTLASLGGLPRTEVETHLAQQRAQIAFLEAQLQERDETLEAIQRGDIDAIVINNGSSQHSVYTLENADHPYRILIEQIQEGAVTLDDEGTVFYCNRRLAALLDMPEQQVIGHSLQPFISPRDLPAFRQLLKDAFHDHVRCELTIRTARDVEVPVYFSLSMMPRSGGCQLLCGVVADLTLQKFHLGELSAANERLIEASAEQARIKDVLRQSQKMEAVGQVTGELAHDFNNLLAIMMGSLENMQSDLHDAGMFKFDDHISDAMASAERGAALTHRLLAFARRQTWDAKPVDIDHLIGGMGELLRRSVGPVISVEIVLSNVGLILCDPNQLENAILNLTINARDAMPEGGRLKINTANIELDAHLALARNLVPGPYVTLSVTDCGVGMSPNTLERAFDPFFTTKPPGQGTGLGLSMVYGFAKQSGGNALIESSELVGTTVAIYLPRHLGVESSAAETGSCGS
jgi:PAS domain S-box-containing protein